MTRRNGERLIAALMLVAFGCMVALIVIVVSGCSSAPKPPKPLDPRRPVPRTALAEGTIVRGMRVWDTHGALIDQGFGTVLIRSKPKMEAW